MSLGPNERCHCGSGLKYKKCHLDADQKAARRSAVEEDLEAVAKSFGSPLSVPVVYHYTSFESARQILTNRGIWATAHDCTNDPGELQAANDAIIEVARQLSTERQGLSADVLSFFLRHYNQLQVPQQSTAYLVCFSSLRDDPRMWQRYGDGGRGLCLGIRALSEQHPQRAVLGSDWLEVVYSEDVSRSEIGRYFGAVCDVLDRTEPTDEAKIQGAGALFRMAAFAAIQTKKPEWSVEHEIRLVAFQRKDQPDRSFEHPGVDSIPRRRLNIAAREQQRRFALDEIVIGPAGDPDQTHRDVSKMLEAAGYVSSDDEWPRLISTSSAKLEG